MVYRSRQLSALRLMIARAAAAVRGGARPCPLAVAFAYPKMRPLAAPSRPRRYVAGVETVTRM